MVLLVECHGGAATSWCPVRSLSLQVLESIACWCHPWSCKIRFQPHIFALFYIEIIIKKSRVKMKAFRQVKRLFLGILCDVNRIHCFRILPWVKFNPDFKGSAFPIEENFHVLTFFSQRIKVSAFFSHCIMLM